MIILDKNKKLYKKNSNEPILPLNVYCLLGSVHICSSLVRSFEVQQNL